VRAALLLDQPEALLADLDVREGIARVRQTPVEAPPVSGPSRDDFDAALG